MNQTAANRTADICARLDRKSKSNPVMTETKVVEAVAAMVPYEDVTEPSTSVCKLHGIGRDKCICSGLPDGFYAYLPGEAVEAGFPKYSPVNPHTGETEFQKETRIAKFMGMNLPTETENTAMPAPHLFVENAMENSLHSRCAECQGMRTDAIHNGSKPELLTALYQAVNELESTLDYLTDASALSTVTIATLTLHTRQYLARVNDAIAEVR